MRIHVTITDDRGFPLHDGSIQVSGELVREAVRPIDSPSKNCGPMEDYIFCTHPRERAMVGDRRDLIAKHITGEIMRFFEHHDTEMGYPKERG